MTNDRRQFYLKAGAAIAVGLLLLDNFVIEPALAHWKEQTTRISALKQKVTQGRQLIAREKSLRDRWSEMQKGNLPREVSAAELAALKAVEHGKLQSQITLTNITQAWQIKDSEGFDVLEYRLSATGSQAMLGRFLYELEADNSVPLNVEEFEIGTRDARGADLNLTARITFLRLKEKIQ